jgi:uncharacterized protein involved in response to NO
MLSVWRRRHPLWLAPHRPLFLGAALCAGLSPIVWLIPQGLGPEPIAWHRHELLFGSGGAALGGYLLTALPAWAGGAPVSPTATRLLVMLWLAGRVVFASSLASDIASIVAASYYIALGVVLLHRICGAGAWGRIVLAGAPFLLGGAEFVTVSEYGPSEDPILFRVLPLFFALLISIVGGRAVPAFTRRWLEGRDAGPPSGADRWMSRSAVSSMFAAIVFVVIGGNTVAGLAMVASAILQLGRMILWSSWKSWRYPALAFLHLAWLWLPLGLVLTGTSLSTSIYPAVAGALHSLTMGAMGTMMFAIMGRAAMTRSNGRLLISREFAFGFGCVYLSVPVRLLVSVAGVTDHPTLLLSAMLWIVGWAFFIWNFRQALRGEVRRPVLSARTEERAVRR